MPSTSNRVAWLDAFRGVAVLGMIWVHTVNTFLEEGLRRTEWFSEWNFFHGLVAPAFFWIAGAVRGLRPAEPAGLGRRSLVPILRLLLLGYALHFPYELAFGGPGLVIDWSDFWSVDVLQTLAASALFLLLLGQLRPAWVSSAVAVGSLAAVLVLTEPLQACSTGLLPLDGWITDLARFPLLPWLGLGLAGFLAGRTMSGASRIEQAVGLLVVGWCLVLVAPAIGLLNPEMFLQRLGGVMLGAGGICLAVSLVQRVLGEHAWQALAPLCWLGRRSLVLYVSHLILIHWTLSPWGSLERVIGPTQTPLEVLGWFLLLTGLSAGIARLTHRRLGSRLQNEERLR